MYLFSYALAVSEDNGLSVENLNALYRAIRRVVMKMTEDERRTLQASFHKVIYSIEVVV